MCRGIFYLYPTDIAGISHRWHFWQFVSVIGMIVRQRKKKRVTKTEQLHVEGMTCTNCAFSVQKVLERRGLRDVHVSFATNEVRYRPDAAVPTDTIVHDIEQLGYRVVREAAMAERPARFTGLEVRFLSTLPFTLLLLAHMVLPWHWLHNTHVQLLLCIPVYLVGMWQFGRSAIRSLRGGVPNMDVLIAMGATAAFGYSLTGTLLQLGPDFLFYETAATILSLVMLGNIIERHSVRQTTNAIRDLSSLQPEHAMLVRTDNGREQLEEIGVSAIRPGMTLQVNEGGRVPIDGEVLAGEASVDESMVTGESVPVDKQPGDTVIGGTILSEGQLRIQAIAAPGDTTLDRIIALVKQAQDARPPIQRLADRISAVFVPVVVAIAVLTFVLSFLAFGVPAGKAILSAVAVLVIACPCAMGLATPTAVMVGVGRAARRGILIKGGDTVEELAKTRYIVFDKTGTLTTGEFDIRIMACGDVGYDTIASIILALEQRSSHPIAVALTRHLAGNTPSVMKDVREKKGQGMEGTGEDGHTYRLGSTRMLPEGEPGKPHDLYLMRNEDIIATIDLRDSLKSEAADAIARLKRAGYVPVLLSGDRREKCQQVAEALGIERVYAEHLPDQKLKVIDHYRGKGKVAMVGDGINDAPALAHADVGISLSDATHIAIQSARVVLLQGNLERLPEALSISRHTVRTIRQNLFWAFFYNTLAIPVAAVGLLNPMIAAFSMAFSDVIVVGNSIRLRFRRLK